MAYYKNPKQMYEEKAEKAKKAGDVYWAKAMNGEGDENFGIARKYYKKAEEYRKRAEQVSSEPWSKKGKKAV